VYRYTISRGLVDKGKPYKVGTTRVYDTTYDEMQNRVLWLHSQGYQRVTIQTQDTWSGWTELRTSRVGQFYKPQ
jgi:hypothetical protein